MAGLTQTSGSHSSSGFGSGSSPGSGSSSNPESAPRPATPATPATPSTTLPATATTIALHDPALFLTSRQLPRACQTAEDHPTHSFVSSLATFYHQITVLAMLPRLQDRCSEVDQICEELLKEKPNDFPIRRLQDKVIHLKDLAECAEKEMAAEAKQSILDLYFKRGNTTRKYSNTTDATGPMAEAQAKMLNYLGIGGLALAVGFSARFMSAAIRPFWRNSSPGAVARLIPRPPVARSYATRRHIPGRR